MAAKGPVVLAAGGTGGHVFPAEALAREMQQRGYTLALVTDKRGDAYGGALGEMETHRILAGGIAGKGPFAKIRSVTELGLGTFQARSLLRELRPCVVVGFGGYASVPTMMAARFSDTPAVIHEQNAILGRANRLLADRVDAIALSFPDSKGVPPRAREKTRHTGMPVRSEIIEVRETPYPSFTDSRPLPMLILGGSQGARVLSDVVPDALKKLPDAIRQRLVVTQQCRPEDVARVKAAYEGTGIQAELATFFDDVPARLANAVLVIGRSGASTVAEVMAVGRPAILIPYAHAVDDHQSLNAHAVDEVGAGWLIPEPDFTADNLSTRLQSMFGMPMILEKAANASMRVGIPDAAKRLADVVESVIAETNGNGERRAA